MSAPLQILLFLVITALTLISLIIGFQIYKILHEVYKMMTRINCLADETTQLTQNFSRSIKNFWGFSEGLKMILNFTHLFQKREEKNEPRREEKK